MDNRNDVRDFLSSRRARITPERAGLPTYGDKRRVPGLRREEVALLAGVSVDYYIRLERGNLTGVSESVLEALARALQLDEAERAHLFDLARTAITPSRPQRRSGHPKVRPNVQRILDAMTAAPAYVRNARLDILSANDLGFALYSEVFDRQTLPMNLARFLFLDPKAKEFFVDWNQIATDSVAVLRGEAGRSPSDRALSDLVGELSTRSEAFRTRWAAHDVRLHRTAVKRVRHRVVGELEITGQALELPGEAGLTIIMYTAEPDSAAQAALSFLASWTATQQKTSAATQSEHRDA